MRGHGRRQAPRRSGADLRGRRATCVWRIPATAAGKRIAGSVAAAVRGEKLAKQFSFKIR